MTSPFQTNAEYSGFDPQTVKLVCVIHKLLLWGHGDTGYINFLVRELFKNPYVPVDKIIHNIYVCTQIVFLNLYWIETPAACTKKHDSMSRSAWTERASESGEQAIERHNRPKCWACDAYFSSMLSRKIIGRKPTLQTINFFILNNMWYLNILNFLLCCVL